MYVVTANLLEQEHCEQVATLFRSFRSFVTTATTKHCNKNALNAIDHWIALHERCLPTIVTRDNHPSVALGAAECMRIQHEEDLGN
jgi:hypothetical protein